MIRPLWPLLIGFTLWAIAFATIYALQALGCILSWPPFWHRTLLIAISAATILALSLILHSQLTTRKSTPGPFPSATPALTLAALAATVITLAPTLFATMCV